MNGILRGHKELLRQWRGILGGVLRQAKRELSIFGLMCLGLKTTTSNST